MEKLFTSNCAICGSKKSRFTKEKEAIGFLNELTGRKVLTLKNLPVKIILF